MKRIRYQLTIAFVVLTAMLGTAGVVSAQLAQIDCPSSLSASAGTINNFNPSTAINGNVVTYSVSTVAETGVAIKELCVYPTPAWTAPAGTGGLTALFSSWTPDRPDGTAFFGFMGTGTDVLNANGNTDNVGQADYSLSSGLPTTTNYLVHVVDNTATGTECGASGSTCWKTPGSTSIPEFPTVALPIAGVIGLVFFFQHRKRKEE